MPPLSPTATLEPEAPVEQKTNVHAGAAARSAVSGDPAPGTTADPRAGQSPIDDPALRGYPPIAPETPGFDVAALRRFLDGDQAAIKNRVRALLCRPEFRYYEGTDTVGLRERVFGWAKEIANQGIGGLLMPRSVGGQDDLAQFMAAFETLGFHDVSLVIKFGVQFGLWGGSVLRLGTDYHHQKYLPATATMALPGCFAMTEIGHGSNVRDIETTATYDPAAGEFDLHSPTFTAGKNYIGNAGVDGKIATVFAQLKTPGESHGVHAFVVPIRDDAGRPLPGVRLEDNGEKLGLNGVDNGRLWFDHVRVPRAELLDRYAQVAPDGAYTSGIASPAARFFTTLGTLVAGRISVGHSALSIAKVGLAIAVRYGARRRQFGPAEGKPETILLDYPAHQRRLMPLLANAYALDAAFKHLTATALTTAPGEFRQVETTAAALKAFSTWNTTHTLQTGREACGGEGYLAINRFAALKADSDIFTTFEGDNTVLMQLVAKNLLTDFAATFKGKTRGQLARWALDQKLGQVSDRNPFGAVHGSLLDVATQKALFQRREERMLTAAGARLRRLTAGGRMTAYAAFTARQNDLLNLAFAHVERWVHARFDDAIRRCPDASLRPALTRLRDLFALAHLEKGRAWFLENGLLSPARSRELTRQTEALCAEVRREAVSLVDAFGVPPECLAAPIALD